MNIYDYAMQMEKDSEYYYRQLAGNCDDTGLKTILNMLADEEVKHYHILDKMKSEKPEMPPSEVLAKAKNIFAGMKKVVALSCATSQIDLYKKAQELEKKAEEFYRQKAGEEQGQVQKELLLKIAQEESRHYLLLENIIQFVSRPQEWLENAEWHHLEEY